LLRKTKILIPLPGRPGGALGPERRWFPFSSLYDEVRACDRILAWAEGARLKGLILPSILAHYVPRLRLALGVPIVAECPDMNTVLAEELVRSRNTLIGKIGPLLNQSVQRRHDRRYLREFDELWATCEEDASALRSVIPHSPILTIASALPDPEPVPGNAGADRTLLFVGNLSFGPNANAARVLALEVLPRVRRQLPDARARVVGGGLPPSLQAALRSVPGLTLVGRVDALAPEYAGAGVVAVPLTQGAGPKLKTIEAMAYGRPIVTTSTGLYGLRLRNGENCLVADDWSAFARACVSVLRDPALTRRLGEAARAAYEAHHTYRRVRETLARSILFQVEE
jgi:glycosyltransferase involved in cell wall biosynthesis